MGPGPVVPYVDVFWRSVAPAVVIVVMAYQFWPDSPDGPFAELLLSLGFQEIARSILMLGLAHGLLMASLLLLTRSLQAWADRSGGRGGA